jgi:hypothetical protein
MGHTWINEARDYREIVRRLLKIIWSVALDILTLSQYSERLDDPSVIGKAARITARPATIPRGRYVVLAAVASSMS